MRFIGAKELAAAKSYPLILALHGKSQNNENGKQVGGWMKSFAKPEHYAEKPCIITPFSPASGPATSSFNGLHPKSKFLAIGPGVLPRT